MINTLIILSEDNFYLEVTVGGGDSGATRAALLQTDVASRLPARAPRALVRAGSEKLVDHDRLRLRFAAQSRQQQRRVAAALLRVDVIGRLLQYQVNNRFVLVPDKKKKKEKKKDIEQESEV